MAHTEKQKLQKARAWFKFVLTGMAKPVEIKYLTTAEKDLWNGVKSNLKTLIDLHDENSRLLGLKVPEVEDFLKLHTIVDEKYFFVPFWYEKLESGNFKAHSLEKLPEKLKQTIKTQR